MSFTNFLPVSVVIPTLGGNHLSNTINFINTGDTIPYEILICIPKEYLHTIDFKLSNNVILIPTEKKGQVYQRSIGFSLAKSEFILQLDDDLKLTSKDIIILIEELNKKENISCIGPQFYNQSLKQFCYLSHKGFNKFESYLIEYFIGGAKWGRNRLGTISKSGHNFGFDINYMINLTEKVEWLAGGCILHRKSNLILDDYFPFSGKAYCEDLMHSILLRKNHVNLYITKRVICELNSLVVNDTFVQKLQEKTAIEYTVYLMNGSMPRYIIRNIYWSIRYHIKAFLH
jgi:glycosyltransferase involved in cell wall biosynthesis